MAAPVIAASVEYAGAAGDTWDLTAATEVVSSPSAGDVVLVFLTFDGAKPISDVHYAAAGGDKAFVNVASSLPGTPASYWWYRYCDGTEGAANLHIVGTDTDEPLYSVSMRITGVNREYPLIIPAAVVATTANPDPPAIPALKESRDVLYIAATSHDHTDTWSSDPSGYATVQNGNSGTGSGDCGGAVAYLAVTGSDAVDPGTFTNSGSEETVAWTIAVLGDLSPVVAEQNAVAVPPTAFSSLGKTGQAQNYSLAFVPRESCNIEKIAVYMAKVGSPTDDIRFSVRTTYDGANAATTAAVDVQAAGWYEGTIASPYAVTAGTTYFLGIERTGEAQSANYYNLYVFNTVGTTYWTDWLLITGWAEYGADDYSFQVRKTTAVEWVPVDPMGASGFFGV